MRFLRRPPVRGVTGAMVRRVPSRTLPIIKSIKNRNSSRQMLSPVSSSPCGHVAAPPTGLNAATFSDFASFLRAELGDDVCTQNMRNSPQRSALTTERRAIMAEPGVCVLHPNHSAVWAPILSTLRARGALTQIDCTAAHRFLPAATYVDLLPWLWAGEANPEAEKTGKNEVHGVSETITTERSDTAVAIAKTATTAAAAQQSIHASDAEAPLSEAFAALRSAPPNRWVELIDRAMSGTITSEAATRGLARIQRWQEVFYALSLNAAFATSPEQLRSAHTTLLTVVDRYYMDCVAAQADVAPPRCNPSSASHDGDHVPLGRFTLTRMPPALLRHWKGLYRAHFAMLDYAALLERVVEGEETVAEFVKVQVRAAVASEPAAAHTFPRTISTALLDESALFLFYLTIPGRREAGLEWEEQWARTLTAAAFGMRRLYRVHVVEAAQPNMSIVSRAAEMLMNVCVWVRNNNEEGTRCLALSRVLLETYLEVADAAVQEREEQAGSIGGGLGFGALTDAEVNANTHKAWLVVQSVREAALEAMMAKATRLQFACSIGLFDVAVVAAAMEVLRPEADTAITSRDVRILLADTKPTAADVWRAAQTHPSGPVASRYGLIATGLRIVRALVKASASHTLQRAALRRLGMQLREWTRLVGAPLRLRSEEMEGIWLGRVLRSAASARDVAWADVFSPASHHEGSARNASGSLASDMQRTVNAGGRWTCGCGFTSPRTPLDIAVPACAACVLNAMTPHCWQCTSCGYTANTGASNAFCLHCGSAHPALTTTGVRLSDARKVHVDGSPTGRGGFGGLFFVCDDCHQCSAIGDDDAASAASDPRGPNADAQDRTCPACGSSHGYARGAFTWRCGCGSANSATQGHCSHCTMLRAEIISDEEETRDRKLPQAPLAIAVRAPANFTPVYCCIVCQHDVEVKPGDTGLDLASQCPHCHHPHPRQLAALSEGRRMRCPGCHALLSCESDHCPHCHTASLSMLAPLLGTVADQPWNCHHCGYRSKLHTHCREGHDHCHGCGVQRVAGAASEPGSRWQCTACGGPACYGRQCPQCLKLPPAVPLAELHVWRCRTCETTLNYSWQLTCSLPGCGGQQPTISVKAGGEEGTEGEDAGTEGVAWRLPYAPWLCEECGHVNATVAEGVCAGCRASATNANLSAWANAITESEQSRRRINADVLNTCENASRGSALDAQMPLTLDFPATATRLAKVEKLLLHAVAAEEQQLWAGFPAAQSPSAMPTAEKSPGVADEAKDSKRAASVAATAKARIASEWRAPDDSFESVYACAVVGV